MWEEDDDGGLRWRMKISNSTAAASTTTIKSKKKMNPCGSLHHNNHNNKEKLHQQHWKGTSFPDVVPSTSVEKINGTDSLAKRREKREVGFNDKNSLWKNKVDEIGASVMIMHKYNNNTTNKRIKRGRNEFEGKWIYEKENVENGEEEEEEVDQDQEKILGRLRKENVFGVKCRKNGNDTCTPSTALAQLHNPSSMLPVKQLKRKRKARVKDGESEEGEEGNEYACSFSSSSSSSSTKKVCSTFPSSESTSEGDFRRLYHSQHDSVPFTCSVEEKVVPRRTTSGGGTIRRRVGKSRFSLSSLCSHFLLSPFVFLLLVGLSCVLVISPVAVNGDLVGGVITVPLILDRVDTPYYIREDVIIAESGELVIRPGVQMLFSPTVGITVFGRLIAEVRICNYFCKTSIPFKF